MPTEDQLIRQLRILYGITPDGDAQGNVDIDIREIEAQMAETPERIIGSVRNDPRGLSRTSRTAEVANPQYQELQKKLLKLKGQHARGPSSSEQAEATQNRSRIDETFSGIRRSTMDDGTRELNTRFTDTLRRDKSSLAARGLIGGSAARSRQSRTLSDLLMGRQRLAGAADAADQSARQTFDEQRQATERQIKLGTQPDISTVNAMRDASAGLNQAYRGLTEQALGGLFMRAGDTYRDTEQADANGRRGWGSLAPSQTSTAPAGGRIY